MHTPEHCDHCAAFMYEACDVPEGQTLRDWRRSRIAPRRHWWTRVFGGWRG